MTDENGAVHTPWSRTVLVAIVGFALIAAIAALMVSWIASAPAGLLDDRVTRLTACAAVLVTALIGYVQWPSRWNLVAHSQLAFALFAFVVPILVYDPTDAAAPSVWAAYTRVVVVGAFFALLGAALAGYKNGKFARGGARLMTRVDRLSGNDATARRVAVVLVSALLALVACFAGMGFVPALADDPFAAKFFRGEYAESYRPVAPLYRVATALIALLLPMSAYYAWRRRTLRWALLFAACVGGMLLTLQRGPALGGVLLFAGVIAAQRRWRMPIYLLSLIAVYFVGSAVYAVFDAFGIGNFGSVPADDLLASAAGGAPDVADSLTFLQFWLASPDLTLGRTFVGGLVPGNFEWNPSVWTLTVTNPGATLSTISSGGFRLPTAIWGFVSFGWVGVAALSLVHGWLMGRLARAAREVLPRSNMEATVLGLVLYGSAIDLFARFYTLSYMTVVEVAVLVVLLLRPRGTREGAEPPLRGVVSPRHHPTSGTVHA